MSKKALNLFQDNSAATSSSSANAAGNSNNANSQPKPSNKRKSRTTEYYKQRFRKNFAQLLEEDATHNDRLGQSAGAPMTQPPPSQQQSQLADGKKEESKEDNEK